jgi:hypothetical protein
MVKRLVDGNYEPMGNETRQRLGLPPLPYCPECKRRRPGHRHEPKPDQASDEPVRRVLTGGWKLPDGRWGSIEDLIGESA